MEENVNEILGVKQSSTPEETNEVVSVDNSAESALKIIANIILGCGIIASAICLGTLCFVEQGDYSTETVFNPTGFAITIMVLFSSLVSWGLLKVIANISLTLKEINAKTK